MAGVNLRVATLKNANLQNCDLRAAVLAGADLEVHIFFAVPGHGIYIVLFSLKFCIFSLFFLFYNTV